MDREETRTHRRKPFSYAERLFCLCIFVKGLRLDKALRINRIAMLFNRAKMNDGAEGLPFGDPMDKNYMLQMPKEYAEALHLPIPESKVLKFDNFIKEENLKDNKQPNKVKSVKEYNEAVKDCYVKLREDYIHSFIDEHERGVEPEEEE